VCVSMQEESLLFLLPCSNSPTLLHITQEIAYDEGDFMIMRKSYGRTAVSDTAADRAL